MQQGPKNILIEDLPKLKWACRRGMLELDVLLRNFLDEAYLQLPDPQKQAFITLLETSDPELFSWLMGRAEPADPKLAQIVKLIQQHARSRLQT